MNKWMNYHHLLYFKVIAEEASISKAAEKLLIGQPTLSTQLKQLEESFGVQLIVRKPKELTLTEHGEVVYSYAKEIFKLGAELQEVMAGGNDTEKPILRIGALDSIPRQILSRIVRFAREQTPCKVYVYDGTPDVLLQRLKQHKIDLLLTTFLPTGSDSKGIFPRRLSKTPVAFFGAPKEAHVKDGFPESLKDYPIVMPTYDSKLRYDIDKWFRDQNIEPNIIVESQDISVKKNIAMEDIGILPTAEHTVERQVRSGVLVPIGTLEGVFEELFLLSVERKVPNNVARHVFDAFEVSNATFT